LATEALSPDESGLKNQTTHAPMPMTASRNPIHFLLSNFGMAAFMSYNHFLKAFLFHFHFHIIMPQKRNTRGQGLNPVKARSQFAMSLPTKGLSQSQSRLYLTS
jgi:hypothetical protein